MGHELRRSLADLAPTTWRPLMRLVAYEIADRSPDPSQIKEGDGNQMPDGAIRCWALLEGHDNKRGEYVKGLTDYLGMSARQICDALKALAEAKYETRIQLLDSQHRPRFDKHGQPMYAVPGQSMRFMTPPLALGLPVDNPVTDAESKGTQKGTHDPGRVPEKVPTTPVRVPKEVPVFPTEDLSLFTKPSPNSGGPLGDGDHGRKPDPVENDEKAA